MQSAEIILENMSQMDYTNCDITTLRRIVLYLRMLNIWTSSFFDCGAGAMSFLQLLHSLAIDDICSIL